MDVSRQTRSASRLRTRKTRSRRAATGSCKSTDSESTPDIENDHMHLRQIRKKPKAKSKKRENMDRKKTLRKKDEKNDTSSPEPRETTDSCRSLSSPINSLDDYNFEEFTGNELSLALDVSPCKKMKKTSSSNKKTKPVQEQNTGSIDSNGPCKGVKRYLENILKQKSTGNKPKTVKRNSSKPVKSNTRLGAKKSFGDSGICSPTEALQTVTSERHTPSVSDTAPTSTPSVSIKSRFKKSKPMVAKRKKENQSPGFVDATLFSPVERVPGSEVRGKLVESPNSMYGSPELKRKPVTRSAVSSDVSPSYDDEGFLSFNNEALRTYDGNSSRLMENLKEVKRRSIQSKKETAELFSSLRKNAVSKKKMTNPRSKENKKKLEEKQMAELMKMNEEFDLIDSMELEIE